jgi:hypothetical protein
LFEDIKELGIFVRWTCEQLYEQVPCMISSNDNGEVRKSDGKRPSEIVNELGNVSEAILRKDPSETNHSLTKTNHGHNFIRD